MERVCGEDAGSVKRSKRVAVVNERHETIKCHNMSRPPKWEARLRRHTPAVDLLPCAVACCCRLPLSTDAYRVPGSDLRQALGVVHWYVWYIESSMALDTPYNMMVSAAATYATADYLFDLTLHPEVPGHLSAPCVTIMHSSQGATQRQGPALQRCRRPHCSMSSSPSPSAAPFVPLRENHCGATTAHSSGYQLNPRSVHPSMFSALEQSYNPSLPSKSQNLQSVTSG